MEAAARPQADEYLASTTLESLLKLDGVIAGVEDEQRDAVLPRGSPEQGFDLLGRGHVGLPVRMDARGIHRGRPALAGEAQPRDELVGPSGDDGHSGGVSRRMVVEASLGAALRVRAGPHAHVHGVYGRTAPGEQMRGASSPRSASASTRPRSSAA